MHYNNKLQHVDVGKSKEATTHNKTWRKYCTHIYASYIFLVFVCNEYLKNIHVAKYKMTCKFMHKSIETLSLFCYSYINLKDNHNRSDTYSCNQNCLNFYQTAIQLNTNMWHKWISAQFYYLLQTFRRKINTRLSFIIFYFVTSRNTICSHAILYTIQTMIDLAR